MIKGTNQQIIEILETGSIYYERAILMVRPQYYNVSKSLLNQEAKSLVQNMQAPSFMKRKKPILYWLIRLGVSAIVGGIITYLIMLLI